MLDPKLRMLWKIRERKRRTALLSLRRKSGAGEGEDAARKLSTAPPVKLVPAEKIRQVDVVVAGSADPITLVVIGEVGTGKSETGNVILGETAFVARSSEGPVTTKCEAKTSQLTDGTTICVIDTPGLNYNTVALDATDYEINRSLEIAKDFGGINAMLLVFPIQTPFNIEGLTILKKLESLFDKRIMDYVILVFTGVDRLQERESFSEFISQPRVQGLIEAFDHRFVVFNNKTSDKQVNLQMKRLMIHVESIFENERGRAYSAGQAIDLDELVGEHNSVTGLENWISATSNEQLNRITQPAQPIPTDDEICREMEVIQLAEMRRKTAKGGKCVIL